MSEEWKSTPRVLVCAAIKKNDRIIVGPRHYDSIMRQQIIASEGRDFWKSGVEQGFIDQMGDFYTRESAWYLADENNQIIRRDSGPEGVLFSENLY